MQRTMRLALTGLASLGITLGLVLGSNAAGESPRRVHRDGYNFSMPDFAAITAGAGAPGPAVEFAAHQHADAGLYAWLSAIQAVSGHSDAWILALGTCEQGSVWNVHGPTFEGHFGMMAGLWDRVRDPSWPDNMGDADYGQQMLGVRRALAAVGDGAWGCSGRAWGAVPGG